LSIFGLEELGRKRAFKKSEIGNLKSKIEIGGKGIRTPDFQLAKLALYQLSYAPAGFWKLLIAISNCES
jgi:hypothetical protein